MLIANSNLVGKWATWEHFRELEARGLMMYGQMTAGSWIYIGSQGIVQGTFETFAARRQDALRDGDLAGRFVLSGGLGGMGGAQPLAATMAGGVFLGVEVDPARVQRRLETRYLDELAPDLDAALARVDECRAQEAARARSRSSATRPMSTPSSCGAASRPTSSPIRRARTIRWSATSRRA